LKAVIPLSIVGGVLFELGDLGADRAFKGDTGIGGLGGNGWRWFFGAIA
jgi:hypothetical protein